VIQKLISLESHLIKMTLSQGPENNVISQIRFCLDYFIIFEAYSFQKL